jgi:hypothetical protein
MSSIDAAHKNHTQNHTKFFLHTFCKRPVTSSGGMRRSILATGFRSADAFY